MILDQAERALESGNLIKAYNLAREASATEATDPRLRFIEVLSLARMGDTSHAWELYDTYDLGTIESADALSLKARLLKDNALNEEQPQPAALREAAEAYRQAFAATGSAFPLVNAATLACAAGDRKLSRSLAETVLHILQSAAEEGYWPWITKAEAYFVLGREDEAVHAARAALAQEDASLGARSSTIKQFERLMPLISAEGDLPEEMLGHLRPPPVIHYCGHMFSDGADFEARLAFDVQATLTKLRVQIGYGALAAGSDIILAEQLMNCGAELNVVLPFSIDEFKKVSVAPAGPSWIGRFDRCCTGAASVTIVSNMAYVNDPRQIGYGGEVAMGMTVLRSSHLGGRAHQLAIWDGGPRLSLAGTSADVSTWAAAGRDTEIIPYPAPRTPGQFTAVETRNVELIERDAHAILFADFSGFSKIGEQNLIFFWNGVMGRIAKVLDRFSESVLCKNTWGDALYLIINETAVAAELALSLQEEVQSLDMSLLGPESRGLRVALHYGTMYRANDPVTERTNYFGSEVSKAARLEPVTPHRSVYVTQPFAAVLALKKKSEFDLHYIGDIALAKDYGNQPIYRLQRSRRSTV